jgi:hypothetical protein
MAQTDPLAGRHIKRTMQGELFDVVGDWVDPGEPGDVDVEAVSVEGLELAGPQTIGIVAS